MSEGSNQNQVHLLATVQQAQQSLNTLFLKFLAKLFNSYSY